MSLLEWMREGQGLPTQLALEPAAVMVRGDASCQTTLELGQGRGLLPIQPEGMVRLAKDGLHNLAHSRHPATPLLQPGIAAVALGRTDH